MPTTEASNRSGRVDTHEGDASGNMSLSNNLNEALSMSLPGNPTNNQMEEVAKKFPSWRAACWPNKFPSVNKKDLKLKKPKELLNHYTSNSHSRTSNKENNQSAKDLLEFPLKMPKNQQSKFPLRKAEVDLMTKKTTEIVKNSLALTEVLIKENVSVNIMSFPKSKSEKDQKSTKFPTHTKIFENALSELTSQLENFKPNANRSHFDQYDGGNGSTTQRSTMAFEQECEPSVQKFPIIKKQFFNFPIGREERVINAKEMTLVLAWGETNAEIMKIHNERQIDDEYNNNKNNKPNNNNNIKYISEHEEYEFDKAMQTIHGHALNLNAQNKGICAIVGDGEGEINMTGWRCRENADNDGNSMVKSKIKHQQAENFNDAFKTTNVDVDGHEDEDEDANNVDDDDAMNLLKFKNKAKNTTITTTATTQNEMCEQKKNRKFLPEILKRDEKHKNMTKAKSTTTRIIKTASSTTTTPTLSKNLANQEQPKQSIEHSFHINELNTNNNNNNGEYKQPDNNNNNNNNHPQQSLAKQSETQPKNPKHSDVREPSSGLADQQELKSPHEGVALNVINFIKTTSPLVADIAKTTATAVDDIDVDGVGVRYGNASSLAAVASLALCVSTTYDEHSADAAFVAAAADKPNIEKSQKSNDISYSYDRVVDDDDRDDYVASDDVNDYVDVDVDLDVESKCADILTDVIDLIEQTTNAIIITGNLLADVRVRKENEDKDEDEDGLPEVSVRLPEAMTVTKVNGQAIDADADADVCAEREQKLLNETSSVVDELDEMKFEMKRVKGSLPARNAHTLNTSDKNNFVASTARMSDISARKHDVLSPTRTTAIAATNAAAADISPQHRATYGSPRLNELAMKRESLTRMHDSSTSSHTAAASGRLTPLSPTLEAVSPTAAALSRTTSLDLKRVPTQSSVDSVLPERTLLRRQKRMRSVGSVEEKPEDVIERLNKLKARISGALSEVKSVIKQYSTESEADAASELSNEKLSVTNPLVDKKIEEPKSDDQEAGGKSEAAPVQFRFVRKVRRRSVFNEEDEYKAEEEAANDVVDKKKPIEESKTAEAINKQNGEAKPKSEVKEDVEVASKENLKTNGEIKPVDEGMKEKLSSEFKEKSTTVAKQNGEIKSQAEAAQENGDLKLTKHDDDLREKEAAKTSLTDFIELKTVEQPEERVKSKLEFLHKVAQELYKKPISKTATTTKDNLAEKQEKQEEKVEGTKTNNLTEQQIKQDEKVEQTKIEAPKPTDEPTPETEKLATVAEETATKANAAALPPAHPTTAEEAAKPKKKIVMHKVKTTTKPRRASIAAVEESKIEPPVQSTLAHSIKTQRRPSDSEAIVKKKASSSNKLASTSATAVNGDELLPKAKLITKVKRASIKGVTKTAVAATTSTEAAASNQEQDKIQLKVKEGNEQATTQKSVAKSKDNNNKIEDVGDKNANNSNKDVVGVPSQTTTLVTEAQPKQLKIDSVGDADADAVVDANRRADDVTVAPCDKSPKDNANVAATNEPTTKATFEKRQEASASQLSASKANGQIERISDKLAELVGETIIIAPVQDTVKDNATQSQATQDIKLIKDASDSKELIHQTTDIKIPTLNANEVNKQTPALLSESTQAEQQVAASESNEINAAVAAAAVAFGIDAAASKSDGDAEPQIANESLSACDTKTRNDETIAAKEEATKVDATAAATTSVATHTDVETSQQHEQQLQQHSTAVTAITTEESKTDKAKTSDGNAMPELKVSTGPVQPVKLGIDGISSEEVPFDVAATQADDAFHAQKKKIIVKKLVRKNSIDRAKEKADAAKLNNILKDKHKISDMTAVLNKNVPPKKQSPKEAKPKDAAAEQKVEKSEEAQQTTTEADDLDVKEPEIEPAEPPAPAIKKPRKIKKKVIIKRQKRRLSIGDTFFIQQEEEPKVPEIEVIEKAIAYVTDDEADDIEPVESKDETDKPLKTCLHNREYKVGELVLYAERFRKTQVKWKRGRVLERITSISYKLDVEGKEVAAHVSYIKKWTGRKVNFGIKEYLEIDYEQVVEEERRARSYSIWNMV